MTKKVLLIGPFENKPLKPGSFLAPPLGCYRLKSWLCKHKVECTVYDPNLAGNMEQAKADLLVLANKHDIVGSSIYQPTMENDLELFRFLRAMRPEKMYVCGGEGAVFNYHRMIKEGFDAVVLGMGEEPLLSLAMGRDLKSTGSLIVNDKGCCAFTQMTNEYSRKQFRDYSLSLDFKSIPYEQYWKHMREEDDYEDSRVKTVRLITSSHCPRKCSFCSSTHFLDYSVGNGHQKVLWLSPEEVVWQLQIVSAEVPGARTVFFNDDDFLMSEQRVVEICGKIRERLNGRFQYIALGRADMASDRALEAMKGAGFVQVNYGIESFSNRVLRDMNKRTDCTENFAAVLRTLKHGIVPLMNLIVFYPTARLDDIRVTIDNAVELVKAGAIISYWPMVEAFEGAKITEKVRSSEYEVERFEEMRNEFVLPVDMKVRRICLEAMSRSGKSREHLGSALEFFVEVYRAAKWDYSHISAVIDSHGIIDSIKM